jgi:hypothetical protein
MRKLLRSRAFTFTLTVDCIRRDALTPFYKRIGGYTEFRTLLDTNDPEWYAMPTEVEIVRVLFSLLHDVLVLTIHVEGRHTLADR